jgi:redox-sensitive bicupin YhaK (pirin superfamily)
MVYSVILDPGQHLVHSLLPERRAWLQVVEGELTLGDIVLSTGDSAGMTDERSVSLTARAELEILLLDLGGASRL